MTAASILAELEPLGSEQIKRIFMRHGAREPLFGVKVGQLKPFQKRIRRDYALSLDLYASGNSDAMYLAGLISDPARMREDDLNRWAAEAYWYMLSDYAVAWTAAESPFALKLAREWMDSGEELIASAGWCTYASALAIRPDSQLDAGEVLDLLRRAGQELHQAPNRTRYAMNGFVIAAGSYMPELTQAAIETALRIGQVSVDMGGTACKVPDAPAYIRKVMAAGKLGQKRKTAKC
jgi:3-methyladenine DNA glycosylase AlkD